MPRRSGCFASSLSGISDRSGYPAVSNILQRPDFPGGRGSLPLGSAPSLPHELERLQPDLTFDLRSVGNRQLGEVHSRHG